MEKFLEKYAAYNECDYNCVMRSYNNLTKISRPTFDCIVDTKIKMGRDLYKQDMHILANTIGHYYFVNYVDFVNYDEFILSVDEILTKLNILNLSFKAIDNFYCYDFGPTMAYYVGKFLEDEPVDIKIELKD